MSTPPGGWGAPGAATSAFPTPDMPWWNGSAYEARPQSGVNADNALRAWQAANPQPTNYNFMASAGGPRMGPVSMTQTPSQNQQSTQPAPSQPPSVQAPAAPSANYGYGAQPTYGAPIPSQSPAVGPAPSAPAYAPPPAVVAGTPAPVAPTIVRPAPVQPQAQSQAQAPTQIQAPVFMPRQTIMSMPPVNPLHAAIQGQMAGGSFQSPFFAEATSRRHPGYQSQ